MASLLARFLALAASGLLAFGLLECGVRTLVGEQPRFPRHVVGADFGVRINEPGARYRHRSADVDVGFEINAKGLRDPRDFPYEKPPGTFRIVSLGDSFTMGYEVEVEETFSQVLESRLRAAGRRVEVLNAGVSGYSNAEALLYLERELLRYQPDVVMLSFFGNDLVDNVRTGLFRLEGDALVAAAEAYVPAGRLGNFLNTNPVFNFLGERSSAFVLLKEKATLSVRHAMVAQNEANLASADREAEGARERTGPGYPERLAAALVDRMHAVARANGAAFLLHSIASPAPLREPKRLLELFPVDAFSLDREGFAFVPSQPLLEPHRETELLYHTRSHGHWTPFAHRVAGEALARAVIEAGWLRPPAARRPPAPDASAADAAATP
ncbi:MAG: hypothetical protein HKP30_16210, partial [Myxococcales bacterium]|nr:hypothetical protein [Myxococcales bacterium]